VSLELHRQPEGRWELSCGHCGGPLAAADSCVPLDALLVVLGVPVISPADDEQAIALAEREHFSEQWGL
jgi:hypothetical protein